MRKQHYKTWWITLVLGLLMPGVGHIYNGHLKRGLALVLFFHGAVLSIATVAAQSLSSQLLFIAAFALVALL